METDITVSHIWQDEPEIALAVKVASGQGKGESESTSTPPGFVWLGGFKSDMTGTKAEAMVLEAHEQGCDSLRFDYSGHGSSGGKFVDGCISRWVSESLAVIRTCTNGPQVLVGSSMGGWIALRVCQELMAAKEGDRLAGLLLIAPAPDFTKELMEPEFSDRHWAELEEKGYFEEPTPYSDEPNVITKKLIEDGRNNLVLNQNLALGVPVHIIQGTDDPDVPPSHAERLMQALPHDNVTLTMVQGGDHRLSTDENIALLRRIIGNICKELS